MEQKNKLEIYGSGMTVYGPGTKIKLNDIEILRVHGVSVEYSSENIPTVTLIFNPDILNVNTEFDLYDQQNSIIEKRIKKWKI